GDRGGAAVRARPGADPLVARPAVEPMSAAEDRTVRVDLAQSSVRELNQYLHHDLVRDGARRVEILHPDGRHNLAVGLDADVDVEIRGHAGYFIAGMNKRARVTVYGNVGWSVAENIMSGT